MYTSPDQESVMFRVLNTLQEVEQRMQQEAQRMQQEHNRQMDMMQLMARQMGINIDNLYVAPMQKEVVSSYGIKTHIEPPSYDVGDMESINVGLEECKDTVISAATSMSVEPSNEEFSGMHAVVDVCSDDSTLVISNEVSNIVTESYYTIDQQSFDVDFWDSTMFNMDATLSYDNLMFEVDVDYSPKWSWT